MFARNVEDFQDSNHVTYLGDEASNLRSVLILAHEDGCGFSISDVRITGGWSQDLHYKHHVGMNFVVAGNLTVTDIVRATSWELTPGMLYIVGPKDHHRLSADGDAHMVSVFNPALSRAERDGADGALEPSGEVPLAWQGEAGHTMFVLREEDIGKVLLRGGRVRTSRYLNLADGCGLTISLPRGPADSTIWYKNHVEANYVLAGEAVVEELATAEKWELGPGSLYVVGPRDRHSLKTKGEIYVMSIFNPPLRGDEIHDADGSYPKTGDIPPAWQVEACRS